MLLDFINSLILTKYVTILGECVDYWPSFDHARSTRKPREPALYSNPMEETTESLVVVAKRMPAALPAQNGHDHPVLKNRV